MTTKKAPTETGQGWESGVDSLFSYAKAAFVKAFVLLASIVRAGGAR